MHSRCIGIALMLSSSFVVAAAAQAQVAAPVTADASVRFDIPAGPASQALNTFARQAGIEIVYPYDAIANHRVEGLAATLQPREALRLLLTNLPLGVASDDGRTITLRAVQAPASPTDPAASEPDIVVIGSRGALDRAITTERAADNLVNVVAAEDIGQFADQNVAESLQRLPGVTVGRSEGEGRSVSVRGLPSQFTAVTIDGVRLGTSNNETASVSLDSVSNEQLQQIEITKSVLPSQEADTIGGAINLRTLSAFSGRESFQIKAEGYYGEEVDALGEEISANFTRRLLDDRIGIGASLSYSRRPIRGIELEGDAGLDAVTALEADEPEFLRHNEVINVTETGERTRWNASGNLEFRPSDGNELFLRGTYSRLNDDDLSYQDIWVIEESEDDKILEVRPGGGLFDDVENERRLFFQDITDSIYSISAGGRLNAGGWNVSFQGDWSLSKFDNPNALRGRFRAEELLVDLNADREGFTLTPSVGDEGDGGDPFDPDEYAFNQLLYVQEYREDEIWGARLDLGRDLAVLGSGGRIDFGARARWRDKFNDREEFTGNPRSFDFRRTMEDVALQDIAGPGYMGFFPTRQAGYDLFIEARDALLSANPDYQREDLSASGDYSVGEDVYAGYVQATLTPLETLRLIGGVRIEHTKAQSQGYFTEFDGSGRGPDGAANTGRIVDLGTVSSEYTNWFPGFHVRWEPTDAVVVRGSWNRGIQRPDFNDRVNRLRVQFETDDPDNRDLYAGNPYLEPLTADSFDFSAVWYPVPSTSLQAAFFYKRIDNFFFDFSGDGSALPQLPLRLPADVDPDFESIETTLNGEKAKVFGIELSWIQTYSTLPGLLSGLFTQANLTYADSESTANVRQGEVFALPGQRNLVGNASLGWENERLSMRLAANYRGKALIVLAGDPEEDVFDKPTIQLDFNLRYDITDSLRLYFDAANLNNARDIEYYRGENGGLFYTNAAFGRTYKLGLRAEF